MFDTGPLWVTALELNELACINKVYYLMILVICKDVLADVSVSKEVSNNNNY